MAEVPGDTTPVFAWIVRGANGWIGWIEEAARTKMPVPEHWVNELKQLTERLTNATLEIEKYQQ